MTDGGQYKIDDFTHYMSELKRIAYGLLRGIDSPSLRPSDLVQDALLKEPDKSWQDEQHFLNDTRKKMKQALVDYLRRKNAARRQKPQEDISAEPGYQDWTPSTQAGMGELHEKLSALQFSLLNASQPPDITRLALQWPDQMGYFLDTLGRLEASRPDWAQVVELRVFAGLTFEQIADVMGKSEKTIRTYWALGKGFLQPDSGT